MKYNFCSITRIMPLAAAIMVAGTTAASANCSPQGSQLIKSLNGAWKGGGSVTPIGGGSEPISCRISYASGANSLEQKLACAGTDYRITATSNVTCSGGSISGRWLEQIANNTGSVTGGIGGNYLNLEVDGPNFKGRFAVNFESESKHKVTITQFDPAAGRHVAVATINLTR
ncbi:MAG: hypothetical protein SGJ17_13515 [Hyphomicrobiales bacterium]|nr:hypothetical protein [Hyphomicrobiales bacterium]MDZ4792202.1 hypothetical protein [Hyphomicrobiales bacterium]